MRSYAHVEKNVMRDASSPFVVKLRYSFQDPIALYFVMDYVKGGSFIDYLRKWQKFPELAVAFYCGEVILALEHLHEDLDVMYRYSLLLQLYIFKSFLEIRSLKIF